ncbi:OLC1v1010422C1 [Oldenlandia corymbosa var. corymbosa]|uniref:OLC1v1010422C1 n=1 Tax=Oldenlandia corymbosa var. corymbosa TaxID=529605 RepID=A0AAV1DRA7_OLDCO|nr:OLC1v1010422C1 [Oldenlandia corymbosa var. corymbosa]
METPIEKLETPSEDVIPVDRISNLPDSILCHIFSFLETKTVVATSIFSQRWKILWSKVTTLDFVCCKPKPETVKMNFAQFVNRVLLHVDAGSLDKFRLKWLEGCEAVYVNMWVSYAIARNVRVLKLNLRIIGADGNDYSVAHVPAALFTCVTLENLTLRGPIMVSLQQLISSCPVLESLKVERDVNDNVLVYKISSPSLRQLRFHNYNGKDSIEMDGKKLEIDTPTLQVLQLWDCEWKEFSVNGLMHVNDVKLNLDLSFGDLLGEVVSERCNSIVKVIEALHHVKYLKLEGTIMKALSKATTPLLLGLQD